MSDLIKREDAIKALRIEYPTMPMFKNLREEWAIKTEGFRKAEEVIMSVPSADRPQGEWKRRLVDNGFNADWVCSECGYRVKTDFVSFNFCPNCGARMKGADDEVCNNC